jgi:hypothetical protein
MRLLIPLLHDLAVFPIDSWLHYSSGPEIANLLYFFFEVLLLIDFHELLLNLHHGIEPDLVIKHLELLVEAVDGKFRWFRMVNHESFISLFLDQIASSLNIANNHKLLHYFLSGVSLVNETVDRPTRSISLELHLSVLKNIK